MKKNEYIFAKYSFSRYSYGKGERLGWLGDYEEALTIIGLVQGIHGFTTKEELFADYSFSDSVMVEMASWNFQDLILSALFFYLETAILNNKERKRDFLTTYNWKDLAALIINSAITQEVLLLIKDLGLKKHSSEKIVFSGSQKAIANLYNWDNPYFYRSGLINLLKFLEIDPASSERLVDEALENKSAANIEAFLSSFEERFSQIRE